jgi:hypothetical protein
LTHISRCIYYWRCFYPYKYHSEFVVFFNTPTSNWEAPCLNLGPAIMAEFSWFSSVPPSNYGDNTLRLGHDRFLSHPFQIIIYLSLHSTLYNLSHLESVNYRYHVTNNKKLCFLILLSIFTISKNVLKVCTVMICNIYGSYPYFVPLLFTLRIPC